jgi:transcriptional regulator NrdR family protein
MKQELDSEQIFERLDDMLRQGERKRRVAAEASPKQAVEKEVADLDHSHFEEVPRMMLTEAMMVSPPASSAQAATTQVTMSLEHLQLDEEQVEELVAQIYTDVNARIEASLNAWIDESLQKRVLAMTETRPRDPSLSH